MGLFIVEDIPVRKLSPRWKRTMRRQAARCGCDIVPNDTRWRYRMSAIIERAPIVQALERQLLRSL